MRRLGGGRPPSPSALFMPRSGGAPPRSARRGRPGMRHPGRHGGSRRPFQRGHPKGVGGEERGAGSGAVPACRRCLAMGKKRGRWGRRRRAPSGGGVPSPLLCCRRLPASAARVSMPPPGGQPWDHPPRQAAWRPRPAPRRPQTAGTYRIRLRQAGGTRRATTPAAWSRHGGNKPRRSGMAAVAVSAPPPRPRPRGEGAAPTRGSRRPAPGRAAHAPHVADFVVVDSDKSSLSGFVCGHGAITSWTGDPAQYYGGQRINFARAKTRFWCPSRGSPLAVAAARAVGGVPSVPPRVESSRRRTHPASGLQYSTYGPPARLTRRRGLDSPSVDAPMQGHPPSTLPTPPTHTDRRPGACQWRPFGRGGSETSAGH